MRSTSTRRSRALIRILLTTLALWASHPRQAAAERDSTSHKKDSPSIPHSQHVPAEKPAVSNKGRMEIPGTETTVEFGGYLKLDAIQDFDAIGDPYEFKVNSIPSEGTAASEQSERTTLHARESRLSLEFRTGERFRAFVEGDFSSDQNGFRLRHAYGEAGPLLAGQTWTTFMDITARPLTVDFEGAEGEVFLRQALVRATAPLSGHWNASFAIENPSPEFATPSTLVGGPRASLPDFVARVRGAASAGHLQIAGLLRQLRFDGESGSADQSELGWGASACIGLKTIGQDEFLGQVMLGEGAAHYVEGLTGQNSDAAFDVNDELVALPVVAATVGYTHHWSTRSRSGVAFSLADIDNDPAQGADSINEIRDFRVNFIHSPIRKLDVGAEALWGRRENRDGARGEAWRGHLAFTYHI